METSAIASTPTSPWRSERSTDHVSGTSITPTVAAHSGVRRPTLPDEVEQPPASTAPEGSERERGARHRRMRLPGLRAVDVLDRSQADPRVHGDAAVG